MASRKPSIRESLGASTRFNSKTRPWLFRTVNDSPGDNRSSGVPRFNALMVTDFIVRQSMADKGGCQTGEINSFQLAATCAYLAFSTCARVRHGQTARRRPGGTGARRGLSRKSKKNERHSCQVWRGRPRRRRRPLDFPEDFQQAPLSRATQPQPQNFFP